ncbi:MAG TPA: pyridoxine 5'-phosphate synthase [Thermoanaerobaculia bacterium]|nr:pyridoxine 5'-phosphate synthase [Thermoanaerobaculia bacterium]
MTTLSVNLNKVCLVRNSRGGGVPDLVAAARLAIAAGCGGLTLHPRADARHATLDDVRALAAMEEVASGRIELNVEGDLRPEVIAVVRETRATQYTVVPVTPGEITSTRGWDRRDDGAALRRAIDSLAGGSRISLFVDVEGEGIDLAAELGAAAVELHTFDYAAAYPTPRRDEVLARFERAAQRARARGLRVHAGHDLDLENLALLVERLRPDEVSIGHAIVSQALLTGLPSVVARYAAIAAASS